ncbi:MAG: peptidylprolyl isomerase [Gemmatimonadales bacterium]
MAILSAEDARAGDDPASPPREQESDPQVRMIARRAIARIVDSTFARRAEFPVAAPPVWPEPAWRIRYRALTASRADCGAMAVALADSSWLVRLRAADLVAEGCDTDPRIIDPLQAWIAAMPADVSHRTAVGVSWHPAAHAMVTLSRLRPTIASPIVRRLSRHQNGHLREYAARAASAPGDVDVLSALASDADANVRATAIDVLSRRHGHRGDSLFVAALSAEAPQVVRAAAMALVGSTTPAAGPALTGALTRWVARGHDTERDVRMALRAALGQPAVDPAPRARRPSLPASVVALARGAEVRVRVTMSAASGGGSFVVRMRGDIAPITVARVLELVDRGYYNGTGWHRAEHDFVIQGGSPGENEYVGASPYFIDELGTVPHVRGTIGMSTRGHDTGDGQWFVNLRDNLRLGSAYTVFAEVVDGIEVMDGVMEGDVIASMVRVR